MCDEPSCWSPSETYARHGSGRACGTKNASAVPHACAGFRRGDRLIIALTYGREAQWVANVLAENGCELETKGRTLQLSHPHLFHDEERRAMPGVVRFMLGILNVSDFLELSIAESIASQ